MTDPVQELAALRAEVERLNTVVLALAEATANSIQLLLSLAKTTAANAMLLEQIAEKLDDLTIDSLMKADGSKSLEERIQRAAAEVARRWKMN